jgi:hypothetical protein
MIVPQQVIHRVVQLVAPNLDVCLGQVLGPVVVPSSSCVTAEEAYAKAAIAAWSVASLE